MKKLGLFLTVIMLCLGSCGHKGDKENQPPEDIDLAGEVFLTDEHVHTPYSLTVTEDAVFVINSTKSDTLVDMYDSKGNLRLSFLEKGDGPLEILRLNTLQYDGATGYLYAPDEIRTVIDRIRISDGDKVTIEPAAEFNIKEQEQITDVNNESLYIRTGMGLLRSGAFVSPNGTMRGMVAVFNKDKGLREVLVPYPDKAMIDEALTDWANINMYYPQLRISPKGDFAMITYKSADARILIREEGDSVKCNMTVDAYPNDIYVVETGGNLVQGAMTMDSRYYNLDLTLSDDYAYILYSGLKYGDIKQSEYTRTTNRYGSDTVKVFDREGRHVRTLHLDRPVEAIGVSPDDSVLYAITESPESGYNIIRYAL